MRQAYLHDRAMQGKAAHPPRLQLWQRRNWHWYRAHERTWPPGTPCVYPSWSEAQDRALHTVSTGGLYDSVTLSCASTVSSRGSAAVANGCDVLVTPLQHTLVPPPMCAARVRCSAAVAAVAWGHIDSEETARRCEALAAVTAEGSLEVAVAVEGDLWEETAEEAAVARREPLGAAQHLNPPLQVCTWRLRIAQQCGRGVRWHVLSFVLDDESSR